MIDFDALVLGPAYTVFGVDADVVLEGTGGREETLRVQDHTAGVQIAFQGKRGHVVEGARADLSIASLHPAAAVRMVEMDEKSLVPEDLRNGEIGFNGRTWRIKGHVPKPSPNGATSGEIYLLLEGLDT